MKKSIYPVIVVGAAVLFSACAKEATTSDVMRSYAESEKTTAVRKATLADQWEKGSQLTKQGNKNVKEGKKLIEAAKADLKKGQKMLAKGQGQVEEGDRLMSESESQFHKEFPSLNLHQQ